jgi:hypothetical protein
MYSTESPWSIGSGETKDEMATGSDAPDAFLEPAWTGIVIHELFDYWLLFQPSTPGAIWVPIARARWFWKGRLEREKGKWRAKERRGGPIGKGVSTFEFPVYDGWADDKQPDPNVGGLAWR